MKKVKLLFPMLLVIVAVVFLAGCGKEKQTEEVGLVGEWKYESYVYTFNEDGTGQYDIGGNIMKFTYEDEGTKVSILFEGNTSPMELEYEISDNQLIVTDSTGSEVVYYRQ